MQDAVLLAYGFDGAGGGTPLTGDAIGREIKANRLAWVHFDADHPDTKTWLQAEASYLDPVVIGALLADETRPRMTPFADGVLLILRGVNLNENADPEDMVSIRLWADAHRIISVRKRKLKAVEDIAQALQSGHGPKDTGEFLCMLTSRLFARMEPTLSNLHDAVDAMEEVLLEEADISMREDIAYLRKQAIIFRRYMAPQREAISQLKTAVDMPWLHAHHRRQLQEAYHHVTRYVEDLDATRERAQIVKDELTSILTDRLNKNMYILSVIAAIFLPLGFLTGLLGVNVGGIPGADTPDAFWIFCALLVVSVVAQVVLFKKFRWF